MTRTGGGGFVSTFASRLTALESAGGVPGAIVASLSVNAADYDYVGDGVADDTGAITDALDALTAYSGGAGGGRVILPRTPTNIAAAPSRALCSIRKPTLARTR
jgi:hypothetical protein